MEQFITENMGNILTILAVLAVAVILLFVAKGKYRKAAKQMLLALVMAAEKQFGSGTGEVKYAVVAEALYDRLPFLAQLVFTEKDISRLIEEAVDKMKKVLATNPAAARAITGKEVS